MFYNDEKINPKLNCFYFTLAYVFIFLNYFCWNDLLLKILQF